MRKISISRIIISVFVIPWNNRQFFSYALAVPILLMTGVWSLWIAVSPDNGWLNFTFSACYSVAFAYLAITCHKLILAEQRSLQKIILPGLFTLVRFSLMMVVVYLASTVIELGLINLYINLFETTVVGEFSDETSEQLRVESHEHLKMARYIAYLPSMYIVGRLCLVFPSIALGFRPSLKWSWKATKDSQFQVLFIVALFPWAMEYALGLLQSQSSGVVEWILTSLLSYLFAALGVFAVSLIYKELQSIEQDKQDATDTPA